MNPKKRHTEKVSEHTFEKGMFGFMDLGQYSKLSISQGVALLSGGVRDFSELGSVEIQGTRNWCLARAAFGRDEKNAKNQNAKKHVF